MENIGLESWLDMQIRLYESQIAAAWEVFHHSPHHKIYLKDLGNATFVFNSYRNDTGGWTVRLFKGTKHSTDSWYFLETEKDIVEEYTVSGKMTKKVLHSLFTRADEALQKIIFV